MVIRNPRSWHISGFFSEISNFFRMAYFCTFNQVDTPGLSGPLSGTSCPPKPHLEVMRTPQFLMYLEAFLRVDWSTKVVCCDPFYTCGCFVCVCVHVWLQGLYFGDIYQLQFAITPGWIVRCKSLLTLLTNQMISKLTGQCLPVLGQYVAYFYFHPCHNVFYHNLSPWFIFYLNIYLIGLKSNFILWN